MGSATNMKTIRVKVFAGADKLVLAKFQLYANMETSGAAGCPPGFPLGASLAFSEWRVA
jgi:hypothetical protein